LQGFIRQLKQNIKIKRSTFTAFKNVYVLEEPNEDKCNQSQDSDVADADADFDFVKPLKSNELSNSWYTLKNATTYDYLTEILTKCGACLTSRVALAELIVAIDKTYDYNSDTPLGQVQLEKDRNAFRDCMNELSKKLRTKQAGIMVVSSEWIIGIENNYNFTTGELQLI
jgi:hypothetical protein